MLSKFNIFYTVPANYTAASAWLHLATVLTGPTIWRRWASKRHWSRRHTMSKIQNAMRSSSNVGLYLATVYLLAEKRFNYGSGRSARVFCIDVVGHKLRDIAFLPGAPTHCGTCGTRRFECGRKEPTPNIPPSRSRSILWSGWDTCVFWMVTIWNQRSK